MPSPRWKSVMTRPFGPGPISGRRDHPESIADRFSCLVLILLILHLLAPPGWAERALAGGHRPMPPPETEPSFGLTDGEVAVLAEHLRTPPAASIDMRSTSSPSEETDSRTGEPRST